MTENNDKRPAFSFRRPADRRKSDDNPIPLEVEAEEDLRLSLPGCKRLSRNSPEPVKRQVRWIIDLVSKCEQQAGVEIPEIELDELDDEWEEEEEEEEKVKYGRILTL